uniref:Uncharacterized protein n=1 Tax=Arundo donax TaxID=35708 RepID=A0A0A9CLJ6_ARUDO
MLYYLHLCSVCYILQVSFFKNQYGLFHNRTSHVPYYPNIAQLCLHYIALHCKLGMPSINCFSVLVS